MLLLFKREDIGRKLLGLWTDRFFTGSFALPAPVRPPEAGEGITRGLRDGGRAVLDVSEAYSCVRDVVPVTVPDRETR